MTLCYASMLALALRHLPVGGHYFRRRFHSANVQKESFKHCCSAKLRPFLLRLLLGGAVLMFHHNYKEHRLLTKSN